LGWRLAELAAEQDKQDPVFFLNESWTVIHDKVELGSPGVSSGIVVAAAGNTPGKEVNSDTGKIDFARNATPAKDVLAALDTKPGLNDYPGASDSKFLHAEVERQAIHSQTRCRTPGSRKNPSGFFQDRAGMLTLDICESFELFALVSGCKAGLKVSARHVQYGTETELPRALSHSRVRVYFLAIGIERARPSFPTGWYQSSCPSFAPLLQQNAARGEEYVRAARVAGYENGENIQAVVVEVTAKLTV
jgi:hypothetical protein